MVRRDPLAPVESLEKPVVVAKGPSGTREVALGPGQSVTVGRDPGSDIVVDSKFASKHHAVLRYAGGECVVEDLQSANGTRVNGQPIAVSIVRVGDTVEIGDWSLEVVDRGASAVRRGRTRQAQAAQSSKKARLAITALATMVVTLVILLMLLPSDDTSTTGGTTPAQGERPQLPPTLVARPDPAIIDPVLARAKTAGVAEGDVLFDEGSLQLRVGRYREAVHLFSAALARDPDNQASLSRLSEARTALEDEVEDRMSNAERAFNQLRYADALLDWEAVQGLVEPDDPRYAAAADSVARARERMPRP